ncbi:dihydroorotate dehydrogenase [Sporolactobacillus laevolacticus]|uniref:dihydroorotate dehydrogenase n=1 Tax=Sporolactobacillus laevolacticus TaxID=33018 RepID=UPI0025B45621|nr:dihydroorotate dehydrogenase [Sporolactobacillus laevolacticus]MDN3954706.1 dihydroorotate dehydrogenase [Sporolactobacillus laevolacticus]
MSREPDLSVKIANMILKSPVMNASGTFDLIYEPSYSANGLGAFIPKSVALHEHHGEQAASIFEAEGSLFNAATFLSDGIDFFEKQVMPDYTIDELPLIINISGETADEFASVVERLEKHDTIKALELNLSCPNLDDNGEMFGLLSETTYSLVSKVRSVTDKPLIAKLSPNVTRIQEITLAAEQGGADAFTVANAFQAMSIDIETRKPKLGIVSGSLSGGTIRPLIVYLIFQVNQVSHLPIIGSGGVLSGRDAIEMILAGASAVQVGTTNVLNPAVMIKITNEIKDYLIAHHIPSISDLIGQVDLS